MPWFSGGSWLGLCVDKPAFNILHKINQWRLLNSWDSRGNCNNVFHSPVSDSIDLVLSHKSRRTVTVCTFSYLPNDTEGYFLHESQRNRKIIIIIIILTQLFQRKFQVNGRLYNKTPMHKCYFYTRLKCTAGACNVLAMPIFEVCFCIFLLLLPQLLLLVNTDNDH